MQRWAEVLIVEENQQGFTGWLSAVGCSKNEWGRVVIDTINAILLEQRSSNGCRGADERWPDANSLARYRAV